MRSDADVRRVFELWEQGMGKKAIARETEISHTQVRRWLDKGLAAILDSPMRHGGAAHPTTTFSGECPLVQTVDERAYAYLLGQYLGDGHLARHRRDVFRLRITTCDDYPDIKAECEDAVRAVMPGKQVGSLPQIGCTDVSCYSKHWPCLFPQHGPGKKHERPIMLRGWQEQIVYDRYPELLLRGLIHSDGCRCINRVTRPTKAGPKRYAYPRYFFTNVSGHIRGIFLEACRRLDIDWHYNLPTSISIARRESVARLDTFVGPKT